MADSTRAAAVYLVTFSCYGQHLHGEDRGSVDKRHNQPGTPLVERDPGRLSHARKLMRDDAYLLGPAARSAVLETIREVCKFRRWMLIACHVRTTHLHAVVASEVSGDRIMNDLKAYATRRLNEQDGRKRRRWARGASIRRIADPDRIPEVIRYVVESQGNPMAVYPYEPRA